MAGGGAGTSAGGESDVFNGAAAPDSTMADNFGGATPSYTPQQTTGQAASDYYNSLMRPGTTTDYINNIYQQALGRAPEAGATGMDYWANQARQQGWTGQQLASHINNAAANERASTGFQSQVNPQSYSDQVLNRPSYYNTNPYAVDYTNIFNPRAGSVVSSQQTLTPQQQAQYLGDWAGSYKQNSRAATQAAANERQAVANQQWQSYLDKKAEAEAQEKIDAAVAAKEEEMQQQQSTFQPQYYDVGAKGGLATLKGFKR